MFIVADKDEPGRKHAAAVARSLRRPGSDIGRVEIVEAADGKDATDHLAAGHGVGDFKPMKAGREAPTGPAPAPTGRASARARKSRPCRPGDHPRTAERDRRGEDPGHLRQRWPRRARGARVGRGRAA